MPISRWRVTAAREQQVGDVGARDHQDEAERKKERREQQHHVGRQRDRALPGFEHEVRRLPLDPARQAVDRTFSRPPRVPHAQLRERLFARQPWLQPPDDADDDGWSRPASTRRNWPTSDERRPEVRRGDREPSKAFRHHADNLERRSVHDDRAVEHAGIAREVPGPGTMAEDNHPTIARLVV